MMSVISGSVVWVAIMCGRVILTAIGLAFVALSRSLNFFLSASCSSNASAYCPGSGPARAGGGVGTDAGAGEEYAAGGGAALAF